MELCCGWSSIQQCQNEQSEKKTGAVVAKRLEKWTHDQEVASSNCVPTGLKIWVGQVKKHLLTRQQHPPVANGSEGGSTRQLTGAACGTVTNTVTYHTLHGYTDYLYIPLSCTYHSFCIFYTSLYSYSSFILLQSCCLFCSIYLWQLPYILPYSQYVPHKEKLKVDKCFHTDEWDRIPGKVTPNIVSSINMARGIRWLWRCIVGAQASGAAHRSIV